MKQKSIIDPKRYKLYAILGREISKLKLTWQEIAAIDKPLTEKWVNKDDVVAHSIDVVVDDSGPRMHDAKLLLDSEYGKSRKWVNYSPVDYLSRECFSQVGVFANQDLPADVEVPGVIGFLAHMDSEEIIDGLNDFSIISSDRANKQWLMLGPISFLNASCEPNVAYVNVGSLMICVTLCEIKEGDELTMSYQSHFFGEYNVDCLCPYKKHHGNPFEYPQNRKRRKMNSGVPVESTPLKNLSCNLSSAEIVGKSTRRGLPARPRLYFPAINERQPDENSFMTYDDFFKDMSVYSEVSSQTSYLHEISESLSVSSSEINEQGLSSDEKQTENVENDFNASIAGETDFSVPPLSPIRLHEFEDEENDIPEFSSDEFEPLDFELYEGSDINHEDFMKTFNYNCIKHKLSDVARNDFLKIFAHVLPQPNRIFSNVSACSLPLISSREFGVSKFITVDIVPQLQRVCSKNSTIIRESWSSNCSWETANDMFSEGEVDLVLNSDGAPLFKSRNLSVWPVWVQVYNLSPILRSSFINLSLIGVWYGLSKPDFSEMLSIIALEIKSLCSHVVTVENLGPVLFKFRTLVSDMPATASLLCMKQFNGYYGCPHCFIKGFRKDHRTLFGVNKAFMLRENDTFLKCGQRAQEIKGDFYGVKSSTPLNAFFKFPWDCPVDPMHQIFIGTGKVLSKSLNSLVKGRARIIIEHKTTKCKVPFDVLHRPISLEEIQRWKAFDFKLFFFHIAPLVFKDVEIHAGFFESFCQFSIATRLLSDQNILPKNLEIAEELIRMFFSNFTELYGDESQSFNFHTMRHLVEQVRRLGPLWLFTCFCFEGANHELMSALRGTIKHPEKMATRFLEKQLNYAEYKAKNKETKNCLDNFTCVNPEARTFIDTFSSVQLVYGRHKTKTGKIFCSLAYTRLNQNLGEVIVQISGGAFIQIFCFAVFENESYAIAKPFEVVSELNLLSKCGNSYDLFFKLSHPGCLMRLSVKKLMYKCVVLPEGNSLLVSVMREGFEHN